MKVGRPEGQSLSKSVLLVEIAFVYILLLEGRTVCAVTTEDQSVVVALLIGV